MLIAQATDLHLRADPDHPNHARFRGLLDHLLTLDPLPDALVISGDLADDGQPSTYRLLRSALERWPSTFRVTVGNHDDREALFGVFPEAADESGFAQSTLDFDACRVILVDTLEPGRSGGGFDATRADWLRTTLAREPDEPALIILHHPPADIGVAWVDPGHRPPWAELLAETIAPFEIAGIAAGHVHAGVVRMWRQHRLSTSPAVSSDLSLMFAPMTDVTPDGRPLVERGDVGFSLHRWAEGGLCTYFARCPNAVTDRWDEASRAVIEAMMQERSD